MSPEESTTTAQRKPPRVIARRMAVGYGLVSIVAVAMCGILLSLISDVSGLVDHMRDDEAAIKGGLALSTSIREQYIHQAHWIIERDDEHLRRYEERLAQVKREVAALRPLVPAEHRERLENVARDSEELDRIFRTGIRPTAESGFRSDVRHLHEQANAVSRRASEAADTIARSVEARMAKSHMSATRSTTIALVTGAIGVSLILALSVMFTLRLRRSVLKPLDVLADAARRFGAGDFDSRVGTVGEGELLAVASAFDAMAEELDERERRLVESSRMAAIGQLAAGVAHEINNPIQVIRGYLKTMSPDSPRQALEEELQILDEEAGACQRIAEDLVAYSRSSELQRDAVDIGELLRETARRFAETPEGRGRRIEVDATTAQVIADAARLRQVLLNLLVNAAQVSETDDPIELLGRKLDGDGYEMSVSDRGPGIDESDKPRIFEPFFSKRAGGSGLGLAVTQGIVRAHGGSISAHDRANGGTTMRVTLLSQSPDRKPPA